MNKEDLAIGAYHSQVQELSRVLIMDRATIAMIEAREAFIHFDNDTNRTRHEFDKLISATSFSFTTRYRPARGFARHVRRMKQQRRTSGLPPL